MDTPLIERPSVPLMSGIIIALSFIAHFFELNFPMEDPRYEPYWNRRIFWEYKTRILDNKFNVIIILTTKKYILKIN